jgi:MYXO-CTERM domain-containing protein
MAGACVPPVEPPDAGPDASDDTSVDTGVGDTGTAVDTGTDTAITALDTGSPSDKPTVTGGYGACKTAAECASGFCVDGVCCDRACDGTCESCTMPFAPGKCVPVPIGLDPKMQCSAIPCTRTCNGAGGCITAFTGAQCASARCTGPSTGAGPAICAAEGAACATDMSIPFDCGAYACAAPIGACFQMCTSTDECAPGNVCDLNAKSCVPGGAPTDDGGGCSVRGAGNNSNTGAIAALFALVALARMRRRTGV